MKETAGMEVLHTRDSPFVVSVPTESQPFALSIPAALDAVGHIFGRSQLFALIRAGEVDARKLGKRTVIMADSLRAYIKRQPRAGLVDVPTKSSAQPVAAVTLAESRPAPRRRASEVQRQSPAAP
jgi:hypothetical protein